MKTLAEFLERPAGETTIGFALMGIGAAFWAFGVPKSEDIIVAGFTLRGPRDGGSTEERGMSILIGGALAIGVVILVWVLVLGLLAMSE